MGPAAVQPALLTQRLARRAIAVAAETFCLELMSCAAAACSQLQHVRNKCDVWESVNQAFMATKVVCKTLSGICCFVDSL